MRVLALDIGDARIGVASGDTATGMASPVAVLPANEVLANARTWRALLDDHEPEMLVVGEPRTLSGELGPQATKLREQAQAIARSCGLPVSFADERLSSSEAKRILRSQGLSERAMRGKVDMVAASLFLETWLRSHGDAQDHPQKEAADVRS